MSLILTIDLLGTMAFAISGALTAQKKRLDLFGIFIIAFVTAVGGGTLRDVLLNAPITWMKDLTYFGVIAGAALVAILFRSKLGYVRRSLFLFDTIGIALYTVLGIQKGLAFGFPPITCATLGIMSACFGGVIRDILCNEIPLIFHKEIYATACIGGGLAYFLLLETNLSENWVLILAGGAVFLIRLLAVIFHWSLPSVYRKKS